MFTEQTAVNAEADAPDDWAKADENGDTSDDRGGGVTDKAPDDEGMEEEDEEEVRPRRISEGPGSNKRKDHLNIVFIGHVGMYSTMI